MRGTVLYRASSYSYIVRKSHPITKLKVTILNLATYTKGKYFKYKSSVKSLMLLIKKMVMSYTEKCCLWQNVIANIFVKFLARI